MSNQTSSLLCFGLFDDRFFGEDLKNFPGGLFGAFLTFGVVGPKGF
jgi:hypothetical protein